MLRSVMLAVAVLGFGAAGANAAVMQFDYTGVLSNFDPVPQTEGDIANLDVSNRTRDGFGNANVFENHVEYWETGYGNPTLTGVAYPSSNGNVGEFQFTPAAGYSVTISSFEVGSYNNGPARTNTFSIYDGNWNQLWTTGSTTYSGAPDTETPNVTFAGTVYLQFGADWDVGIDNINYDVAPTNTVPLPATLPLLGAGIAVVALLRRRVTA